MIATLLLLLIPFLTTPQVPQCFPESLKLQTSSLSESQVRAKAKAVWGGDYLVRTDWRGDRTYSIRIIGRYYDKLEYDFGFSEKNPRKRRIEEELGRNERGSWRQAWNAAMVKWCEQGGSVIP